MCDHGTTKTVPVKVPADLSHTGKTRWKLAEIDSCIAPLVNALQKGGINMRSSCCGHGSGSGSIELQDGRTLLIVALGRQHLERSKK